MKKLPHIISKVFEEPWVITTAKHRSIQRLLEKRLEGGDISFESDDEAEEPEMAMDGSTAIIPVHGIIGQHLSALEMMCGGCDTDRISAMMDSAEQDEECKAILFDFRSPGGTVTGVPELARRIANCSKRTVAFTDSECCSGAIWLASQCREFYATESACVGSIGVYMAILDHSRALENEGVNVQEISAGKYKTAGAPWRPLTKEEAAMFQASVDKTFAQFREAMTRNREIDPQYMEGQTFDGEEAAQIGLIDGVVESITDLL